MKNRVLFFLFFLCQIVLGQTIDEKIIEGKIVGDSTLVERVSVINESNGTTTISDAKGMFSIKAKAGDVLVFSAVNLVTLYKSLKNEDMILKKVNIEMDLKNSILDEVVVNGFPDITSENLGIIRHGQKKYSPAERKLYTARSGILNRTLNWISGRTAMLKKEVNTEKKEQDLLKLSYLFEDKYYLEILGIPVGYIRGFQYYCIEDSDFMNSIYSKNKTMSMFLIIALAKKYKNTINYEN